MGRLCTRGKYVYQDGQKFFARGLSYGPFAPNSRGESYPEPERAAADFALMRAMGANLVRTYTMPPAWLFELAAKHELRLMVGISWPFHLTFLDSPEMRRAIRQTVRREVAALRQFKDVMFAYSLGNEIRADIVRWHGARAVSRFLADLYDIGKQLDPDGLFTYSNYPSVEYLDLSFLDIVSFNVYLHRETDFRRYLTHLLAITGERPLVLSETGMDTIREGEQHQADILAWQARAAFELGLSGLVIFAFTDEWFAGGAEITDWAFGVTTRVRAAKTAFAAVGQVFHDLLPPTLNNTPSASVVVPAYNAARTIVRCLETLKRLNYPDYEILVVDDGSSDSTAALVERAGVRVLKLPHQGLAAARNAALEAARGRIVAFIDADAEADRDWLYHLAEAIGRRDRAAAGGQNFPPPPSSALKAAIAAAPGQPREVRLHDQDLAQLCGCSMAVDKLKLGPHQQFDPAFTSAGDDVDFSRRLSDTGATLAYAPGAVVLHERRATVAAYLKQQRGYGQAEGLLFRKYPNSQAEAQVYGRPGRFARWFAGQSRIYYGSFGRGLFQAIYPAAALPAAAQLPLTFTWAAIAVLLLLAGECAPILGILGAAGLLTTVACALVGAMTVHARMRGFASRAVLAGLWLLGPLVRSWECERVKWRFRPDAAGAATPVPIALSGTLPCRNTSPVSSTRAAAIGAWSGERELGAAKGQTTAGMPDIDALAGALHLALVRRGLAVEKGNSYDAFDLRVIVAPWIRVQMLFLNRGGAVSLGWRTRAADGRAAGVLTLLLLLLLIGGFPLAGALAIVAAAGGFVLAVALYRARQVPAVISAACLEIAGGEIKPPESGADPLVGGLGGEEQRRH